MPGFTEMGREQMSIAGEPINCGVGGVPTGQKNTGTVDMSKFHRCIFLINVGSHVAGTVDGSIRETDESGGGNSTNISGSSLAQITSANVQASLEVNATQVTKRYILFGGVVAGATVNMAVIPIGFQARNSPANVADVASVNQRKAV